MSKKLTAEEHQEILDIRKSANEVASLLGEIHYQKTVLDLLLEEQKVKIQEIKKREFDYFEKIRSSYGNVSLNLDTGDIA